MEEFVQKGPTLADTIDIHSVVGRRVLCESGKQLGKVKEVRVREGAVVGVVVRRIGKKPVYVDMGYIKDITPAAVLLKIDPSLYKGFQVITLDGKRVGRVKEVIREKNTNTVTGIVMRKVWRTITIPAKEIKSFGPTIMLKQTYDEYKTA